jgi:hypothetical protein
VSDLSGSDRNQEVVGLLRRWQHAPEEHFVLPLPNTGLGTFKNAVNHRQGIIWIESSDSIEAYVTDDLRPRPNPSVDWNAGGVEVRRSDKPPKMTLVLPKAVTPNAPKPSDRDEHICHAPFNRLFFRRSAYNSPRTR